MIFTMSIPTKLEMISKDCIQNSLFPFQNSFFQRIDRDKLSKQFGPLTAFSITTEEHKTFHVESSTAAYFSTNRPLLLKLQTLASIETG